MSLISWNCRGLGRPTAISDLKYLIRNYNPAILFLSETIVLTNKIEEFKYLLGYDSCFAVDRVGRSGGLAMFWHSTVNCQIVNYSNNHISLDVIDNDLGVWRLTGYYGYPNGGRRRASWEFLRQLAQQVNIPWCIFGDFNDIMDASEKRGRTTRPPWLINGFRQAVLDVGLSDVPVEGYAFTWFKSLGTPRAVEERLDRALANSNWFNLFPNATLENLAAPASDHYPILLTRVPQIRTLPSARRFRFENSWKLEPGFDDVVKKSWYSFNEHSVVEKLDRCAADISAWSRENCNRVKKDIVECRKQLVTLRSTYTGANQDQLVLLRKKMNQLLEQDDAYWRQRAKKFWYKDGDRNTKFFHASATARKKVNRILSLVDDNGVSVTEQSGLGYVAKDYFLNLFQKKISQMDPVLAVIPNRISQDDNVLLTAPFLKEEFREAIFSMHPDKCSGPDGYSPGFYQHFWNTCSNDIFKDCCTWLDSGNFPASLNTTNIALIPKGTVQTTMKDWRPIALCNVLYKIIAKVLANRLKRVLPKCISDHQSAFVPGRSILDNAMVAIEVIHHMKSKVRGKTGCVALKLDISKAYDRMDWDYLKEVMRRMGFNDKWVHWMTMCVETVDYSVLVNSKMVGPIIPGRGLRQGDPLSPYLFIICAEGLSSLIRDAEHRGVISGTSVCGEAPPVTHLLFADDCFLFFKACANQAQVMKDILTAYEVASGQAISLPKSEIYYSRNVPDTLRHSITHIMGVQAVLGTGKYLGLPSMIGRDRTSVFAYIKDRVWQKINSWSSKCLSKAGKEIMIKSVLQAIPSYVMSIFLLPKSIISAIEKLMNSFWWGHSGSSNRGIHWMSWDKLSVHKNAGGMGFKDLKTFNLAMLGKQGWKFMSEPDSLVSRIFKARYFPHSDYLSASLGNNPSYVWRSILEARFIVRGGARWCIGSGALIPILNEPWLSGGHRLANDIVGANLVQGYAVKELMYPSMKEWNREVISHIFSPEVANSIVSTPLLEQVETDKLVWKAEKNGIYSVKSAYRLCVDDLVDISHLKRPGFWSGIWRLKVPPKVKNLLWRMCRGCLPTRVRLQDKGVTCPVDCVMCDGPLEDLEHVCFLCPFSVQVWQRTGLWHDIQHAMNSSSSASDTIFAILQKLSDEHSQRFAAVLWSIWKHRNLKLWQDASETGAQVLDRAIHMIEDWREANLSFSPFVRTGASNTSVASTSHQAPPPGILPPYWKRPSRGRLKCNVDASFSDSLNKTGIGICLRDDEGTFVLAKTVSISPRCPVPLGEALGLFHAIRWLSDMKFDNVDFALDSQLTTTAFNHHREDVTEFGQVISACKRLFTSSFTNSQVEFNKRQANVVAHTLARVATLSASSTIHIDVPPCIEQLIINEML